MAGTFLSQRNTPCKRGWDSLVPAQHPLQAWLGHSCPSKTRRRGRRRYTCGWDIPIPARLVGGMHGQECPCYSGLDIPVQARLVIRDADATPVAGTFVSQQGASAGTPTVRFATPRKASHLWLGHSCPSTPCRRYARTGMSVLQWLGQSCPSTPCRRYARTGMSVLQWLGQSCPSTPRRRYARTGMSVLQWLGHSCPSAAPPASVAGTALSVQQESE